MATQVQPPLTISESNTCVALELSRVKYNLFVTLDMLPITKDCVVPEESVHVEASSILSPTDQPMKTSLCSRVIKFTPIIAAVCASKLQVRVIGQPIK